MEIEKSPSFCAFTQRLSEPLVWGKIGNLLVKDAFQRFHDSEPLDEGMEPKSYLDFFYSEYKNLGIDALSPEQINALPVQYASSNSFGWGIEAPAGHVFIRVSLATGFGERDRPEIITGVNTLRSARNKFSVMETHPYIMPIDDIPDLDDKTKTTLIDFNLDLLEICGAHSLFDRNQMCKASNFGVRFFRHAGDEWQDASFQEYQQNGNEVQIVPYLFDTEEVYGVEKMEAQKACLQDLLLSDKPIKRHYGDKLLTENERDIIQCHLAYEQGSKAAYKI